MESESTALYAEDYFQMYTKDPQRELAYSIESRRIQEMKPEGGAILDVGCGLGLFLEQFDDKRWQKFGVDISDFAVQQARKRGITVKDYAQSYDYPDETFDVIVFRGTIQHLDTPFAVMKKCTALLKRNGLMAFLVTPNANSIYYKFFNTLPFLHPEYNFYIPSDLTLTNTLKNLGLKICKVLYPYLGTPYARPLRDHLYFVLRCLGVPVKFAFWRNVMEVYAVKPE